MGFNEDQSRSAVNSLRMPDKNVAIEYILSMQAIDLKEEKNIEEEEDN